MQRVEEVPAAERGADRQREALGKPHHRVARGLRPAAAAEQHDGTLGRPQELLQLHHLRETGPGLDRLERRRIGHRHALGQHVLRERHDDGAGPAAGRRVEGARDDLGNARGIVDLGRPLGHGAEHGAVVELLERLALAHLAPDLADEHDHRRGVLPGDVDARRGIGCARPARDEGNARAAGGLADGLRHHRGAALLAADRERDLAIVEGVERGEVALARHAEHMLHAVGDELVDQNLAACPGAVIGAHWRYSLPLDPIGPMIDEHAVLLALKHWARNHSTGIRPGQ